MHSDTENRPIESPVSDLRPIISEFRPIVNRVVAWQSTDWLVTIGLNEYLPMHNFFPHGKDIL